MRTLFLAALFTTALTAAAVADANVAGDWHAKLGSGVSMNMNVTPDGLWSSETVQQNKVVRQMRGTYEQKQSNSQTGTLVFTPTEASGSNDSVHTETDRYEIARNGRELKLTSEGDTMVFERREAAARQH